MQNAMATCRDFSFALPQANLTVVFSGKLSDDEQNIGGRPRDEISRRPGVFEENECSCRRPAMTANSRPLTLSLCSPINDQTGEIVMLGSGADEVVQVPHNVRKHEFGCLISRDFQ